MPGLFDGLLGGGAAPATQTQTSSTAPWAALDPYLQSLYAQANAAFAQSQAATQGGAQQQAIDSQMAVASGAGQGADILRQNAMNTASGMYLNPESNPWLRGAVEASQRPTIEAYTQQIFPQLGSQAQRSGAYGGSRQGVVEGIAANGLTRNLSDSATQAYYQNYLAERNNQINAAGQFNAANNLALTPASIYQNVASTQQNLPFVPVNQFANILASQPGYSQSATTATGTPQGTSRLQGALGGASLGSSLGGMFGGNGSYWGAGLGALLGGLG